MYLPISQVFLSCYFKVVNILSSQALFKALSLYYFTLFVNKILDTAKHCQHMEGKKIQWQAVFTSNERVTTRSTQAKQRQKYKQQRQSTKVNCSNLCILHTSASSIPLHL